MKNFDTELDIQGVSRLVTSQMTVVQETVTVTRKPSQARAYLGKINWSWDDLRDYVVTQIEQRFGTFPRDARKEAAIFKAFIDRWGEQAQSIARFAFEVCDGRWRGAPISVNRFCKNSDVYFASVIEDRLVQTPIAGW